jgi:predicted MPP superfamily phosphohydrolase
MRFTLLVEFALVLLALFGHGAIWLGVNNRLHATAIKRPVLKKLSALVHFVTLAVPLVFLWWLVREAATGMWPYAIERNPTVLFYVLLCIGMAIVHLPRWLFIRFGPLRTARSQGRRIAVVDMAERLGRYPTRGFHFAVGRYAPRNEVMRVEFTEKEVPLPNLPTKLDGLRLVHLSDLHLSGRVDPDFFREVVREINALDPDFVMLTGDVCDKLECVPWIEELLSPLRARYGKFFILGNHDDRLSDILDLRHQAVRGGFVDLGGRLSMCEVHGEQILLAGNELPWFGPAPEPVPQSATIKILLSHSPDQVGWAQKRGFDLMLSGHTHGGQICFPWIGPVVCPSWYGVRYASGLFIEPRLVTHVSRGVSGLFPIRWNCLPEVSLLILRKIPLNGATGD